MPYWQEANDQSEYGGVYGDALWPGHDGNWYEGRSLVFPWQGRCGESLHRVTDGVMIQRILR